MKKIALVMAMFLIAPAMAGVVVTASQSGTDVTISYDSSSMDPNRVRAFALDIVLSNDCNVVSVVPGEAEYSIYPGSIQIDPDTGAILDPGTCVGDADEYPDVTMPGPNSVTVEMGSLDTSGPSSGEVCTITVEEIACVMTVTENAARGGIVMEDVDVDSDPDLSAVAAFPIDFGCACMGDLVGATTADPPDLFIDTEDLKKMIGMLNEAYFWSGMFGTAEYVITENHAVAQVAALWTDCLDWVGATTADPPNQQIDTEDLKKLIGLLNASYFWSGMYGTAVYGFECDGTIPNTGGQNVY